eukprot:scaffold32039_cov197-Isochrysis_galbana.AAC.2
MNPYELNSALLSRNRSAEVNSTLACCSGMRSIAFARWRSPLAMHDVLQPQNVPISRTGPETSACAAWCSA